MADVSAKIVFVNLLREERSINEDSIITRSLRSVERWISQSYIYELLNSGLSTVLNKEKLPQGSAAMHEQVAEFKSSLKPGQCGVIAHGNSFSIMDHRQNVNPDRAKLTALGLENILKSAGCAENMPVILYSCNTGVGDDSLASELSRFHPIVVAPDGVIAKFVTVSRPGIFKGDERSGTVDENTPKQWRVFSHGKVIASYDWGQEFDYTNLSNQIGIEK